MNHSISHQRTFCQPIGSSIRPYYDKIEKLTAWAEERGRGLNELAQAWLMAQPQVCSVISGATKLDQVLRNAQAADWALTDDELAYIGAILDE